MRCTICGGELKATRTDLPFKLRETSIVILKSLPIMPCENCSEYLIDGAVLDRVDEILVMVDSEAELETISHAA